MDCKLVEGAAWNCKVGEEALQGAEGRVLRWRVVGEEASWRCVETGAQRTGTVVEGTAPC